MKLRYSKKETKKARKKKGCFFIFSIILTVIVLSLSILVNVRNDAWFSNIPEEPYLATKKIERITLTPGENFSAERVVSWRYDSIEHKSYIEYYKLDSTKLNVDTIVKMASSQSVRTRAGQAYYYHVNLTDLGEGNRYNYRIISDTDTSDWITFDVPQVNDTLRFMYIGDVQDPIGTVSDSLFNILRNRPLKYDFIAFGGDQIERPMDKYWNIWYKSLGDWAGTVPMINVAGNHEYIKGLNKTLDERWIPQHNYPSNGPKDFKGKSYYIDFPLMRMIIIDSNIIQWPDAVIQHSDWLKETMESTTQPWKVVMFHHGVHSVREGRSHVLMRYIFGLILESYGADLVLQGHDHAYSRITTKLEGDTVTPVFVTSVASPKFYRNGFDPVHDRLGSGIALYQTIEVTKDELNYKSFLFDGALYDDLSIHKDSGNKAKITDRASELKEIFMFDGFGDSKKGQKKRNKYLDAVKQWESRFQSK